LGPVYSSHGTFDVAEFIPVAYEGASLHGLTAAMDIQPASLYAAFGNKQALFGLALSRYLSGQSAFCVKQPRLSLSAVRGADA
jgi:AcrR family transcriptional regulator